ncbi:MAG: hypothetical protein ACYDD4_11130 [Acidimicrobiales bacterium]
MDDLAPRWQGEPGRIEVWYATLGDSSAGTGLWIHHELLSPVAGDPYLHGWAAWFAPGRQPVLDRFGPEPVGRDATPVDPVSSAATIKAPMLRGRTERLAWDLQWHAPVGPTLYTFPAAAWRRQWLPAAQVVPVPSASFSGSVEVDGERHVIDSAARGAVAHIYGHSNAQRWGWLHAELGNGDALEVVAATSRRPPLDRFPPLAFVQLRRNGVDWPQATLAAAPLFRTELRPDGFTVRGTMGRRRLTVEVTLPEHQRVTLDYTDPDGASATCTNSECADAHILFEQRVPRRRVISEWHLAGSAHAEVGTRP